MAPVQVFHDNGQFWFSVSTPGSYGILHTTLQMLLNIIDFGADIQAAIDAPRFRLWEGTRIQIENRFSPAVLQQLSQRGHHLELIGDFNFLVGGGQGVMIDQETGTRLGTAARNHLQGIESQNLPSQQRGFSDPADAATARTRGPGLTGTQLLQLRAPGL